MKVIHRLDEGTSEPKTKQPYELTTPGSEEDKKKTYISLARLRQSRRRKAHIYRPSIHLRFF